MVRIYELILFVKEGFARENLKGYKDSRGQGFKCLPPPLIHLAKHAKNTEKNYLYIKSKNLTSNTKIRHRFTQIITEV
jgi:hypothetical protein